MAGGVLNLLNLRRLSTPDAARNLTVIESGTALEKREKTQPRRYTYDELVTQMAESNLPCELWDGETIVSPAPSFYHQEVVVRFFHQLYQWVLQHKLGKVVTGSIDMVLSPHRVTQRT